MSNFVHEYFKAVASTGKKPSDRQFFLPFEYGLLRVLKPLDALFLRELVSLDEAAKEIGTAPFIRAGVVERRLNITRQARYRIQERL